MAREQELYASGEALLVYNHSVHALPAKGAGSRTFGAPSTFLDSWVLGGRFEGQSLWKKRLLTYVLTLPFLYRLTGRPYHRKLF